MKFVWAVNSSLSVNDNCDHGFFIFVGPVGAGLPLWITIRHGVNPASLNLKLQGQVWIMVLKMINFFERHSRIAHSTAKKYISGLIFRKLVKVWFFKIMAHLQTKQ